MQRSGVSCQKSGGTQRVSHSCATTTCAPLRAPSRAVPPLGRASTRRRAKTGPARPYPSPPSPSVRPMALTCQPVIRTHPPHLRVCNNKRTPPALRDLTDLLVGLAAARLVHTVLTFAAAISLPLSVCVCACLVRACVRACCLPLTPDATSRSLSLSLCVSLSLSLDGCIESG